MHNHDKPQRKLFLSDSEREVERESQNERKSVKEIKINSTGVKERCLNKIVEYGCRAPIS